MADAPSLRELSIQIDGLRQIIDERHQLYEERSTAAKEAVQAALVAQEKLVNAAFAASKEAILKAEESQKGVNERSNEFRGQLADQAGTLMPRKEAEASMSDLRDRLDRAYASHTSALEVVRAEVSSLKESRSEGSGRLTQQQQGTATNQWAISALVGIAALVLGLLSSGFMRDKPAVIVQPSAPPAPSSSVTDSKSTTRIQP